MYRLFKWTITLKLFTEIVIYTLRHVTINQAKQAYKKVKKVQYPANIYLFKDNNRNTRKRCGIWSKLTIKTSERRHWRMFLHNLCKNNMKWYTNQKYFQETQICFPNSTKKRNFRPYTSTTGWFRVLLKHPYTNLKKAVSPINVWMRHSLGIFSNFGKLHFANSITLRKYWYRRILTKSIISIVKIR